MDKRTKCAFKNLLKALDYQSTRETYDLYAQYYQTETQFNRIDKKGKVTVIGLCAMLNNHHVDNRPNAWGINLDDAHMIRGYFGNVKSLTQAVLELYREFPGKFEGESKEALEAYRVNLSDKEKKRVKVIE